MALRLVLVDVDSICARDKTIPHFPNSIPNVHFKSRIRRITQISRMALRLGFS
jgi:hypothetical protein